jgi:hypothetical protein
LQLVHLQSKIQNPKSKIGYSLATMHGQWMKKLGIETYAGRIQEHAEF